LRRILNNWWIYLAQRTFPEAIISETTDLSEAPMIEESMRKWGNKLIREGREEGREEGLRQGMRTMLLQQIRARFGRLPRPVRQRVEAISSMQELQALGRKILLAETLQDLGLG
jgi:hypothetical protein